MPSFSRQTQNELNNQEINEKEKEKNKINDKNWNKTLFGNDKNIFSTKEPLPFIKSLFGENDIAKLDKEKEENNKNISNKEEENTKIIDNNKSLFKNNKTLFGEDNNNALFEDNINKTLFEDNNKSLLGDNNNKNLFGDNNNKSLFGENSKSLFTEIYNKPLLGDNSKSLFNNNIVFSEKNDNEENKEENEEENIEKNKPKTTIKLLENQLFKTDLRANSEIITILHFNNFSSYKTIKELKNGNFLLLFEDALYYISSKTFKQLEVDKSLNKYFNERFSYFEEINEELIGIISKNFVLIVQFNKTELKFVQEIKIKAKMLQSFPSENLIVIN